MVRPIREEELPALLELYTHLHPEDARLRPGDPAVQTVWQEIRNSPHLRYYVAETEGRLVSTCTLTLIPNLTRKLRPYGLIENVVTDPAYRHRGWATQVLQHALAEAWAARCYKVMLLTGSRQEQTLRFYEKAGFQRDIKTGFIAYPVK